ncbi:hypothetical protein AB3Y40_00925 [Yoonia sp. R2331]|uniref:hypothetical protein n=1 Tax=Yoonia sp. R2331 TaxID=3237238 RepID=UPI0034E545EA
MKRRGFLGMFGAAIAAPIMPAMGGTVATAATYNRYTFGLAVFHARTRAHVSARGLAYCLKVTVPQAEAMIGEMSAKGMVRPVLGAAGGHVRAVSNILTPDAWGLERTARQARARARQKRLAEARGDAPESSAMMAHLHRMCVDYGLTLSPRCAGAAMGGAV